MKSAKSPHQNPAYTKAQLAEIEKSYGECARITEEGMKANRDFYKKKFAKPQSA